MSGTIFENSPIMMGFILPFECAVRLDKKQTMSCPKSVVSIFISMNKKIKIP